MKPSLVTLVFFTFAAANAFSASTEELISQLKAELRSEAKKPADGDGNSRTYRMQEMLSQLLQSRSSGEDTDQGNSLLNVVAQLEAIAGSDKVQELAEALGAALRKEQQSRDSDLIFDVEKAIGESLRQGLAAKTSKEVDAPLNTVARYSRGSSQRSSRNPKIQTLFQEAQHAWQFLLQWQDYLAAQTSGNLREAQQKLQSVLGSGRDFPDFIPRSEILARLEPLKAKELEPDNRNSEEVKKDVEKRVREIIGRTKTLEDLAKAAQEFTALRAENGAAQGVLMSTTAQALQSLQHAYLDVQAGRATQINLFANANSFDETSESLSGLRTQLLLFAIPRVIGLPPDQKAAPEENIASFVQRIASEARTNRDWLLLGRLIEVGRTLNVPTFTAPADAEAIRGFLAGLNQERAQQWPLAVMSFQTSLKSGSQLIPADEIGERLEAIRKAHPQEFERGVQLMLTPPQTERTDPFGRPINMDRFYPPSAKPTNPAATPAPIFAVPAAPAPPTPPPAAPATPPK